MFADIAFSYRVGLLVGLMVVIAGFDLVRHGRHATKYREYGFVLFAGTIAAVIGCLNDLITSSISPEYFTIGKALPEENLGFHAALYGLQVGFSAGVISGGICLYIARRKTAFPPVGYGYLLTRICMLIPAAVAGALLFLLVASGADPFHFSESLKGVVDAASIAKFRTVWWIHTGLYCGLILGLGWLVWRIRKKRRCLK